MRNYCPTCCAVVTHDNEKCPVCGTVLNWSRTGGKMITRQFSPEDCVSLSKSHPSRKPHSTMRLVLMIILAVLGILGIILTSALIAATLIFLRLLLMP